MTARASIDALVAAGRDGSGPPGDPPRDEGDDGGSHGGAAEQVLGRD